MAQLNSKTKFVNLVVRKKDFDISTRKDLIIQWCNANCELYVGIFHMNDKNLDGVIEEPHLHLILTLTSRKLLSTTLNSFCSFVGLTTLGVMIDKVNSYEGSIQYLLHKNDKNKTPHFYEELFHNYDEGELKTILSAETDGLTPQRIYEIVKNAKSNYDIMCALGLGRYNVYRKVILDIKEDLRREDYRKHLQLLRESQNFNSK